MVPFDSPTLGLLIRKKIFNNTKELSENGEPQAKTSVLAREKAKQKKFLVSLMKKASGKKM